MSLIAPTLESFFTDRLVKQQHASPATIGGEPRVSRTVICGSPYAARALSR